METSTASPLPVTLVLLARNEQEQIGRCLASVSGWVGEMVVVDMESSDSTAEIARGMGATVVPHPVIGNFDLARTPGVLAASNDWILVLDADEIPTPALLATLGEIVRSSSADVLHLPRANLNLSGFAPRAEEFPEMTLRMFRRSAMDIEGFAGRIHSFYRPRPGARVLKVRGRFPDHCLLHYTNPALEPLWAKINLYTSEEARSRYASGTRAIGLRHLWNPIRTFFKRWIGRGAWLDGWRGFWLSWIAAVYQGLIVAKLWEMSLHDGSIPDSAKARSKMHDFVQESNTRSGGRTT
jgi:glycosyltransferase involved in cell wall biosynthesis